MEPREEGRIAFEHYKGPMDMWTLIHEGARQCYYKSGEARIEWIDGWDDAADKARGLT